MGMSVVREQGAGEGLWAFPSANAAFREAHVEEHACAVLTEVGCAVCLRVEQVVDVAPRAWRAIDCSIIHLGVVIAEQ